MKAMKLIEAIALNSPTDGPLRASVLFYDVKETLNETLTEVEFVESEIKDKILQLAENGLLEGRRWNVELQEYVLSPINFEDHLSYIFLTDKGRFQLDEVWDKEVESFICDRSNGCHENSTNSKLET